MSNLQYKLSELRDDGWSVAVHNDYRLNGERYTFWLFTHPNGSWIKGEGRNDDEAVSKVWAAPKNLNFWQPIATAPTDHLIEVYAPAAHGAPEMVSLCEYHESAGFTICTLREPTHWREFVRPAGTPPDLPVIRETPEPRDG